MEAAWDKDDDSDMDTLTKSTIIATKSSVPDKDFKMAQLTKPIEITAVLVDEWANNNIKKHMKM